MEWWEPDVLVVQGDIGDNHALSRFSKNPNYPYTFSEEVDSVNIGLDELDALSIPRKIFLEGNHEYRLVRYLQNKAPELFGMTDTPRLYRLKERNYEFFPYKTDTRIGKLWLTHDAGSTGRYAGYRMADLYQGSVACAHTHHMSQVIEGDAHGNPFVVMQTGWMGDPEQVDYPYKVRCRRFWRSGWGSGLLNTETGIFQAQLNPIVNGTVIVGGKEFSNANTTGSRRSRSPQPVGNGRRSAAKSL